MKKEEVPGFIIACLSEPDNAAKQQQLQDWLLEDETHPAILEDYRRLWQAAALLPENDFDVATGWDNLQQSTVLRQPPMTVSHRRRWWKVAAVLLPVLLAAAWWRHTQQDREMVTYIAQGNLKDSLQLPDGSKVFLRPGTVLHYRKNFRSRTVELQSGEAFFDVVKNEQQRFTVTAFHAAVEVLGTSFNIKTSTEYTDVAVWDGKVRLSAGNGQPGVLLTPATMGKVDAYTGQVEKLAGTFEYRCGWANNDLSFSNQSLGTVLHTLSSIYQVRLRTADTALLQENITVRFKNITLEEALAVIREMLDLKADHVSSAEYILKKMK
ncbi:FecR family protein [Chitinophaga qingshengii]|uniref:FecR domain-containing protein n=1 Tax=Chitinophaga qingshengii TaxID=1569794 RepID=A0ABR7TSU2_9BACT|nr:FecR domain-containing protein [Chitinophaga qingshengii]MBC9932667.1 FecR domain-containing protein [Chitinophaga qingshengii]